MKSLSALTLCSNYDLTNVSLYSEQLRVVEQAVLYCSCLVQLQNCANVIK